MEILGILFMYTPVSTSVHDLFSPVNEELFNIATASSPLMSKLLIVEDMVSATTKVKAIIKLIQIRISKLPYRIFLSTDFIQLPYRSSMEFWHSTYAITIPLILFPIFIIIYRSKYCQFFVIFVKVLRFSHVT